MARTGKYGKRRTEIKNDVKRAKAKKKLLAVPSSADISKTSLKFPEVNRFFSSYALLFECDISMAIKV